MRLSQRGRNVLTEPGVKGGFVIAVAGFAFYAILSLLEQPVPKEGDLRWLTGNLRKPIVVVREWRAQAYAYVEIETPRDGIEGGRIPHLCFLWQDCILPTGVANLAPGDTVSISLTYPDWIYGGHAYVWSLRQGESTLLSFRDLAASNAAQRRRYLYIFGGLSVAGLLLAAGAFLAPKLRRLKQGDWK